MNISFLYKHALALVHFKSSTYFILGYVNKCPLKLMNQREEDIQIRCTSEAWNEKKNGNHIKTADSKENSDKAVDVKGIKKTREIPLIRQAVIHRLNHYNLTNLLSE